MNLILLNLFKNTKIKSRLFFTLILLSIPLFCLLFLTLYTQNRTIQFGQKEIIGVEYNHIVFEMIQSYRNLVNESNIQFLDLESQTTKQINSIKSDIEKKEILLQEINSKYQNDLATNKLMNAFLENKNSLSKISIDNFTESKSISLTILEKLFVLNSHVGDTSNLILDPDLDSYYLMDITLIKIPALINLSLQVEEIIFLSIKEKDLSQENLIKLFSLYSQLNGVLIQILESFEISYKYNPSLKSELEKHKNESFRYLNIYKEELKSISNPANKEIDFLKLNNFPNIIGRYNEAVNTLYSTTSKAQKNLLNIRVSNFQFEQFLSIFIVLVITGFTIYIQYLIVFSITNPLNEAVSKFSLLANGNLKNRIEYDGKDEIGNLSNSINIFIEYLSGLLNIINKLSNESRLTFNEISEMTNQLSQSTMNQASSTEESAAAVEEISSSFGKIAHSIGQESNDISEIGKITSSIAASINNASHSIQILGTIVESSAMEVKKGELVISKTVNSMNEIKSAADEISKIIILITEISKQISLLALNASIEAARAGEHGRGFSVVADEISKLSLKTGESVKHIRALISSTNSSIKDGIHNVDTVVGVLKSIITKINDTNKSANDIGKEISSQSVNINFISESNAKLQNLSNQIDRSTKEEQTAINHISQSMNQISAETQLISENLNILKDAAAKMTALSEELTATTGKFEL